MHISHNLYLCNAHTYNKSKNINDRVIKEIPIKAKRFLSWELTKYITDLPKSANKIS